MAEPDVAAVGIDDEACLRDPVGQQPRRVSCAEEIVFAGQDQRRHVDGLERRRRRRSRPEAVVTQTVGLAADRHQPVANQVGPLTLLGRHAREQGRIGCQQRAQQRVRGKGREGPEPEVRGQHPLDGRTLDGAELHRVPARQVRCRHDQDQMRAAVRVAKRELGRRQGPCRSPGHGDRVEPQVIEQLDEHVRLMGRRGIVRKGTAQVAETRWGNDLEASLAEQAVGE